MKKIFIVLFLATCASCSYAYVTEQSLTSEHVLKNLHYSDETIRLININKGSLNSEPTEVPYVNNWIKIYKYLDPATDSLDFGRGNIRFENTIMY